MKAIDIGKGQDFSPDVRTACAFLGSFDPFHKGHEWIVNQLLKRFDGVLLLVPGRHFEKKVKFPSNANFEQRLHMLGAVCRENQGRMLAGLAHEVLFLRLADQLVERFPGIQFSFGMGNDTFSKFLNSRTYYEKSGIPWTLAEDEKLRQLRQRIVVFGRSTDMDTLIPVPDSVRWISSTCVRNTVGKRYDKDNRNAPVMKALERMISRKELAFILQSGLYASE